MKRRGVGVPAGHFGQGPRLVVQPLQRPLGDLVAEEVHDLSQALAADPGDRFARDLDDGMGLAGGQMPPPPGLPLTKMDAPPTARMGTAPERLLTLHLDHHLPLLGVAVRAFDGPRGLQAEDLSVELISRTRQDALPGRELQPPAWQTAAKKCARAPGRWRPNRAATGRVGERAGQSGEFLKVACVTVRLSFEPTTRTAG